MSLLIHFLFILTCVYSCYYNIYLFTCTYLAYFRKSMVFGKHKGKMKTMDVTVMVNFLFMYHIRQKFSSYTLDSTARE